ncbi:MAG TPA: cytochrome c oxidase subunit 4 [Actinomycetota bacterium]
MRVFARIGLLFGGAFAIDAVIYWYLQKEQQTTVLLAMTAASFAYLGLYALLAVRKAGREAEVVEQEEPHVGPTIWPAVFALSAVGIVLGVLVAPWLLAVGGLLFVAAAVGWITDTRRQWRHVDHDEPAGHGAEVHG